MIVPRASGGGPGSIRLFDVFGMWWTRIFWTKEHIPDYIRPIIPREQIMAKAKQRASDDGVLFLIQLRRQNAKEAFAEVVRGFLTFPVKTPRLTLLLDYLTNMVSCLELMLKFLSGDWNSHKVDEMYKTVFGADYTKSDLLLRLKEATMSQKYLVEPANNIANLLPEIEDLYEKLHGEIRSRHSQFGLEVEIDLDLGVGEYLRDNAMKFHKRSGKPGEGLHEGLRAYEGECERISTNIGIHLKNTKSFQFYQGTWSIT